GSVKTNIGHLDAAAGVSGFIKAVLALKYRLIPPSLHYESPNPAIDFKNSPFYVNTRLTEWKNEKYPLRAAVSAFGIGGTNVHIVLEESPRRRGGVTPPLQDIPQLFLLSAKTPSALEKMTENLVNHFKKNPGSDIGDIAYTLQVGRKAFRHRRALVCAGVDEAVEALSSPGSEKVFSFIAKDKPPPVVFMFPGQGSQYADMGLELYEKEPVFRGEMDRCFEILKPLVGYDIKGVLFPGVTHPAPAGAPGALDQTEIAQPMIFLIEYALARLLMNWGIIPYAMTGHSIGEYVAACLAGVFSLEDALKIVVLRGKLMQRMPTGSMAGVSLSPEELQPLLPPRLSPAAVNSPSNCVVSGPHEAVDEFERQMKEKGLQCRRLHTSHAFHSTMMDPVLKVFEEEVRRISLNKPNT
ncbi:MAG: type I polyketide synthase, partial [bacterium]|nr:type I polyketide synthase [bacterium]